MSYIKRSYIKMKTKLPQLKKNSNMAQLLKKYMVVR